MLIHVHRKWAPAGITAGGIVPDRSRSRCKPHLERVEEDPIWIIRIHGDSLVVPVLWVIASATTAVSEGTALRALHVTPSSAAVCRSPRAKLASVGAAAAVGVEGYGLDLRINVVRVTRGDSDIDAP